MTASRRAPLWVAIVGAGRMGAGAAMRRIDRAPGSSQSQTRNRIVQRLWDAPWGAPTIVGDAAEVFRREDSMRSCSPAATHAGLIAEAVSRRDRDCGAATGEKGVDRLSPTPFAFFPESDATESEIDEQIRRRAYEIWEREGRPDGRAEAHWDQATLDLAPDPTPASIAPDSASSAATLWA